MTNTTVKSPKPTGELLDDLLRENGLNQTEAATKLNLTRQYLNGVINGKYPISADLRLKLEPIVRVKPDFWNEAQRAYDAWKQSPEGRAIYMAKNQEELFTLLDVRGQHTLLDHEIVAALNSSLIVIEPFSAEKDEDRIRATSVQLTFDAEAQVHNGTSTRTMPLGNEREQIKPLILKPGQRLTMKTREVIHLPHRVRALINGLTGQWATSFIHCFHERVMEPGTTQPVTFGLLNAGSDDLELNASEVCIAVSFEYLAQEASLQRNPTDK
jgi:addiction module HigA family antidote